MSEVNVSDQSPGEIVRSLMTEKGWSQTELAYALGVTPATVNQIVNSKRSITPEMAKLLAVAFDRTPESFLEVQLRWDLKKTPDPDQETIARVEAHSRFPLREMVKRGWIDGPVEASLCRFFGVNSIDNIPTLPHAAKKTRSDQGEGRQLAWLYRVRAIAKEMPTPAYSRAKLVNAIEQMSAFREAPEETRHVARLLHEAGVRFVIVEGLPGGRIDGVCFWLDRSSPVIGMSLRYDRIDNFWFVLRHECAHVLHGHGQAAAIIDNDLGAADAGVDEEEQIANQEAADFCVPQSKIRSFYDRKYPLFTEPDILAFAKINRVHPGLVIGQLQFMLGQFKLHRQHLVNIRKSVAISAMTDGWGSVVPVG